MPSLKNEGEPRRIRRRSLLVGAAVGGLAAVSGIDPRISPSSQGGAIATGHSISPATSTNAIAGVAELLPDYLQSVVDMYRRGAPLVIDIGSGIPHTEASSSTGTNWQIDGGWFYTETNGGAGPNTGYSIKGPLWEAYKQYGREQVWGPPVTQEYIDDQGRICQATQRGVSQYNPKTGEITWLNIFDELSKPPFSEDDWLLSSKHIPKSFDWTSDTGKTWEQKIESHWLIVPASKDKDFGIRDVITKNPDWLAQHGLPMGVQEFDEAIVVRFQRSAVQLWKVDVPGIARKGDITVVLGGDVAKEAGYFPKNVTAVETFIKQGTQETQSAFPQKIDLGHGWEINWSYKKHPISWKPSYPIPPGVVFDPEANFQKWRENVAKYGGDHPLKVYVHTVGDDLPTYLSTGVSVNYPNVVQPSIIPLLGRRIGVDRNNSVELHYIIDDNADPTELSRYLPWDIQKKSVILLESDPLLASGYGWDKFKQFLFADEPRDGILLKTTPEMDQDFIAMASHGWIFII